MQGERRPLFSRAAACRAARVTHGKLRNMGIVVAAALHGGAAVVVLAALSLIGYAAMRSVVRRWSFVVAVPCSLAVGSLLVGWTAFLLGAFIGTWTILPLFALATLLSLVRVRPWAHDMACVARRLAALAKADLPATIALALVILMVLPQLLLPLVDSEIGRAHV